MGSRLKKAHVTFEKPPSSGETNKLSSTPQSSTEKMRDLIYSILSSAPTTQPTAEAKSSGDTTTSEESSESELA